MHKYIKLFLGMVISIFISYGCEKETITVKVPTGPISFSKVIVPIFQSDCIACHYSGGQAPNLATNPYQSLTSGGYINTSSPSSSKLYVIISNTSMGGTSPVQQQEILSWITQGALNN